MIMLIYLLFHVTFIKSLHYQPLGKKDSGTGHMRNLGINGLQSITKSLGELKWCTHFDWLIYYRFDISSISGMTSLQHLNVDGYDGDASKFPLECFPNLKHFTINVFTLAHLVKIPNPLLLRHLAITIIPDWCTEVTSDNMGPFAELLRFKSLQTLQLGDSPMSRSHMSLIMSSLTQLQRLSIDSIEALSPIELKESPSSTWFGTIPPTLNEICYFQYDANLTPLLAFPSLTKLQLNGPQTSWDDLIELAPKLLSLTLDDVSLEEDGVKSIGKCTRLTSLVINDGRTWDLFNLNEWKSLSLKQLTWTSVHSEGNPSYSSIAPSRMPAHLCHVIGGLYGESAPLLLLQSICSIWSHSLTDFSITILGENPWGHKCLTIEEQIGAFVLLRVIERLTFLNQKDEDLMKLAIHPNLPLTLTDISWKWSISKGPQQQRDDTHNNVRQSFASRGIICHDITDEKGPSP
jgi:hypothetical protein